MAEKRFKKVYIEIGNICNLQCSFCPEVERGKKRLARDEFQKILAQVKPFAEEVCFHVMGEPLAHPDFAAFVKIAEDLHVPVEITSNGTLLKDETVKALLSPIIRQVNFSLQSFFDNFPGSDPETYLEKIFSFTHRALAARPELYLNYRLWNLAAPDSHAKNESLLLRIEKEFQVSINRQVDVRLQKSKKLLGRLYLHYDSRFRWPNSSDPEIRAKGTCHGTRSHVAIHADGTVVPCCLDKEAKIPLGNIAEQEFSNIVIGERLEGMRLGFERGELVEDFCRRCEYSTRFPLPASKN